MVAFLVLFAPSAAAARDVVVNSCAQYDSDPESVTLAEGLQEMEWNSGNDTLSFNIDPRFDASCCDSVSGACRFVLSSPIFLARNNKTLEGPDDPAAYAVILDGSNLGESGGVTIEGHGITIRNLGFENFRGIAVLVSGRYSSVTAALLEENRFRGNGVNVTTNCPQVSNNPLMDSATGTYYGGLLTGLGGDVGINVYAGPPGSAVLGTVTGSSACVEGVDFLHDFHVAAVTADGLHATVYLDERLAGSADEAEDFLVTNLGTTRVTVDAFFPNVFSAQGAGQAYLYQFPTGPIFACPCYSPQVFIRPGGGTTGGAVHIQFASQNTIRGNLFQDNPGFAVKVEAGTAPAGSNVLEGNVFQGNGEDVVWINGASAPGPPDLPSGEDDADDDNFFDGGDFEFNEETMDNEGSGLSGTGGREGEETEREAPEPVIGVPAAGCSLVLEAS